MTNVNNNKVPDWIGSTPFPPNRKKTCKLSENMWVSFLYGFESTQVENDVFASTDKILVSQWILAPGNHYEPAGFHLHGDECYYLLEGNAVAFNAETGETFKFKAGDAMLIPQKTRHQIFNMTDKRIVTLACVAPKIWENDGMGTIIPQVKSPKFLKGFEKDQKYFRPEDAFTFKNIKANINSLGSWPAPGSELREKKQLVIIKEENQLSLIHGKQRHILFSFIVSNDYMNLAIIEVPVNITSEFEKHCGDEVIDLLDGELCIRIKTSDNERNDDATYPHFKLRNREKLFIPEGTWHQYINFTNHPVKAFVAIGPGL
jgi:mannose-6-phosphate isomerase-like protein (cupin superfamily)